MLSDYLISEFPAHGEECPHRRSGPVIDSDGALTTQTLPAETLLPNTAHRQSSGRRYDDGIDLQAVQCNHKIGCYRGTAICEIDGERPRAVRTDRVLTGRHRVSEIGNHLPVYSNGIDLRQRAVSFEGRHGNALHRTDWGSGWTGELFSLYRKAVSPYDQVIVASRRIGLGIGRAGYEPTHKKQKSR